MNGEHICQRCGQLAASIPAHELEHLAGTWRDHAREYCGQGMGIALESCAADIDRLINSYSQNVQSEATPLAAPPRYACSQCGNDATIGIEAGETFSNMEWGGCGCGGEEPETQTPNTPTEPRP